MKKLAATLLLGLVIGAIGVFAFYKQIYLASLRE